MACSACWREKPWRVPVTTTVLPWSSPVRFFGAGGWGRTPAASRSSIHHAMAGGVEVLVDALGHYRTHLIDGFQLILAGVHEGIERAEMFRQYLSRLSAHVADAQSGDEAPQRPRLAGFDAIEHVLALLTPMRSSAVKSSLLSR